MIDWGRTVSFEDLRIIFRPSSVRIYAYLAIGLLVLGMLVGQLFRTDDPIYQGELDLLGGERWQQVAALGGALVPAHLSHALATEYQLTFESLPLAQRLEGDERLRRAICGLPIPATGVALSDATCRLSRGLRKAETRNISGADWLRLVLRRNARIAVIRSEGNLSKVQLFYQIIAIASSEEGAKSLTALLYDSTTAIIHDRLFADIELARDGLERPLREARGEAAKRDSETNIAIRARLAELIKHVDLAEAALSNKNEEFLMQMGPVRVVKIWPDTLGGLIASMLALCGGIMALVGVVSILRFRGNKHSSVRQSTGLREVGKI